MNWIQRKLKNAWYWYNPRTLVKRVLVFLYELDAYLRNRIFQSRYHVVEPDAFRARQTSDVIFIFGAGASLRDISPEEWAKIDQHNTLGWRLFVYQEYVHADFLMIREVVWEELGLFRVDKHLAEIRRLLNQMTLNPRFQNALLMVQEGWSAVSGNRVFGYRLGPKNHAYLRFRNGRRDKDAPPASTFEEGITHIHGSLTDAVNLAYLGGWKHIVLIGIDLYDMAYFNVPAGEKNPLWVTNLDPSAPNSTATSGIVDVMKKWADWLKARGVQMYVYNPRSLMTAAMPVFTWEAVESPTPTESPDRLAKSPADASASTP